MSAGGPHQDQVIAPATCLGCGCACDDISVSVRGHRIVEAANACLLGLAWFGDGQVPAAIRVDGNAVALEAAIDAAADRLRTAHRPLIFIADDLSCAAQRAAAALADTRRALLDTQTTSTAAASILATQERGRAGATLGEIRNRADLLIFWGVDPALRYPRFWSRYAPEPVGMHVAGRRARRIVAIDIADRRGPEDADLRVTIAPNDEVAVLTALDALARGGVIPATSTPWEPARALLAEIEKSHYVALVADGEAEPQRDSGSAAALVALGQSLNHIVRCALCTLRAGGNRSGADAVLTAQTGYPMTVDFARGTPRYTPHDAALARLARGEFDCVLVAGSRAPDAVSSGATIVIGPRASDTSAAIAIDTGIAGIHSGGVALRMDDVPLPLRPSIEGPPAAEDVLSALAHRVAPRGKASIAPRGEAASRPAGEARLAPSGNATSHPAGEARLAPSGNAASHPAGEARLAPSGNAASHPASAEREP